MLPPDTAMRTLSPATAHAGCRGAGGVGPLRAQLSSEDTLPLMPPSSSAALQLGKRRCESCQILCREAALPHCAGAVRAPAAATPHTSHHVEPAQTAQPAPAARCGHLTHHGSCSSISSACSSSSSAMQGTPLAAPGMACGWAVGRQVPASESWLEVGSSDRGSLASCCMEGGRQRGEGRGRLGSLATKLSKTTRLRAAPVWERYRICPNVDTISAAPLAGTCRNLSGGR